MNRLCAQCGVVINVREGSLCASCGAAREAALQRRRNAEFGGSGGRWQTIRRQVLEAQGGCCKRCGHSLEGERFEVDHIIPRAEFRRVGAPVSNSQANLQALCVPCHGVLTAARREQARRAS